MDNECEEVFKKLKDYLAIPPILTWLKLGEVLYIYLITSDKAVSSILIREEGGNQKLIYFTSWTLQRVEIMYHRLEKLVLAII